MLFSENVKIINKENKVYEKRKLEAIVPLYISNYCHSDCKICAMRKSNKELKRIKGNIKEIENQLRILYEIEQVRAVMILSGEYLEGEDREDNFKTIIKTINMAFEMGFKKVNFNIGALYDHEIDKLYQMFKGYNLGLSLFQETYNRDIYKTYFSADKSTVPKADYDFRLSTPQRWINKGFKIVNIGILLGLADPQYDVEMVKMHANFLRALGADVEISLPRIRGVNDINTLLKDDEFINIVQKIAKECPFAKIVLTTREDMKILKQLLPIIGAISPGTSDILPYTNSGAIPNNAKTSQFYIKDKRMRPKEVLELLVNYYEGSIVYFDERHGGD
ncbi:thiamine biosynthesis protein ThiH [Clostridiaceae bacterium M8S5]|nr:thiamine biosynthesis protein ThiH [Clostridiaceae bacterium M8S5]